MTKQFKRLYHLGWLSGVVSGTLLFSLTAKANPVLLQGQGNFAVPILVPPSVPGGSSVSATSSSFANGQGAAASSSVTVTSPNGTISRSASVFTPGATSSSASATATVSTTQAPTASATATTGGSVSVMQSPTTSNVPINNTLINNSGVISTASGVSDRPLPLNPALIAVPATFIPQFSSPFPQQTTPTNPSPTPLKSGNAKPITYTVVGLPSRVFPGLGLRLVPVGAR